MKRNTLMFLVALVLAAAPSTSRAALFYGFTVQGKLSQGSIPYNGDVPVALRLYDGTNATAVALAELQQMVSCTNGLFTALADFGMLASGGDARWLEVAVQDSSGNFQTLSPRQQISPTPSALFALTAATAGAVTWSNVTGVPPELVTTYRAGEGLAMYPVPQLPIPYVQFSIASNGVASTMLANAAVTGEKLAPNAITQNKIAPGQVLTSLNGLTDGVVLQAGSNVTITAVGNTLSIAAAPGAPGHGYFAHRAVKGVNITDDRTVIDNPACNGDGNAILLVVPSLAVGKYYDHVVGVMFDGAKWNIVNQDQAPMEDGVAFNVLVAKP